MQIDYHGIYSCPVGQVIRGVGIELKLKCNFGGIFEPNNSPVCEDQGICSKTMLLRRSCNNTVLIGYTQFELYGTGYMGHFFGLVENYEKIRDVTSL